MKKLQFVKSAGGVRFKSRFKFSEFCMRCGALLDLETALEMDELRAKADKLMSILIQDSEVLEKMLDKFEKVQN